MNFEIKKSIINDISIPSSISSEINKNKNKKLSPKKNNIFDKINKKEKELYNYEIIDQNSSKDNKTSKKLNPKIKFENIFDKNKDYLISQLKKENNTLEKEINEKNNYIEILKETINSNFINKNKYILNENEKIIKKEKIDIIVEYNNIISENKNLKKNIILQQLLIKEMKKDLENIKLNNNNDINGDKNYEVILKEKNDIIKELENKNIKLTNENQILKENKNININLIDNVYLTIKEVSLKLDNLNKTNNISKNDNIKKFIEQINIDSNGNLNIKEKINTINQFNDFIKLEIKLIQDFLNFNKNKIEDKKINNLFNSENGLNLNNNNNNKVKNNKFSLSYFKFNDKLENSLSKYNNRYILSNTDLNINLDKNNKMITNNKKILYRNRVDLKKKVLEKDSLIFKSNLISKGNENKEINTKVKELEEFMNNKKGNTFTLFKMNKKLKIPLPKNKTANLISPNKSNKMPFNLNLSKIDKKEKDNNYYEHIKTDIYSNNKFNLEYIKLNEILKNINNSNTCSNSNLNNKSNENSFKNSSLDLNNPKFLKIKNINEVNGLANEVMKPTFLKNNISLTYNNNDDNNRDKDYLFKDIKKLNIGGNNKYKNS